jgi:hypothetical protein
MRRIGWLIGIAALSAGCVKAGLDDPTRKELDETRKTVDRLSGAVDKMSPAVEKMAPAVDSLGKIDPLGINLLLRENTALRERVKQLELRVQSGGAEACAVAKVPFNPEFKRATVFKGGYGDLIKYGVEFPQPVDFAFVTELHANHEWVGWHLNREDGDPTGRRWAITFQVPAKDPQASDGYAAGYLTGVKLVPAKGGK